MKLRLITNPMWDEIMEALAKELADISREKELPCQCPEEWPCQLIDEPVKPNLKLVPKIKT
jgi:hypothetical protein